MSKDLVEEWYSKRASDGHRREVCRESRSRIDDSYGSGSEVDGEPAEDTSKATTIC